MSQYYTFSSSIVGTPLSNTQVPIVSNINVGSRGLKSTDQHIWQDEKIDANAKHRHQSPRLNIKEGYTDAEFTQLYNSMVNDPKYNMVDDNAITYPPTHPNYSPSEKDVMLDNTNQVLQQQYTTLAMTMVATLSLGIVAYMVSQ